MPTSIRVAISRDPMAPFAAASEPIPARGRGSLALGKRGGGTPLDKVTLIVFLSGYQSTKAASTSAPAQWSVVNSSSLPGIASTMARKFVVMFCSCENVTKLSGASASQAKYS